MAEETNEEEIKPKTKGLIGKLIIPMVLLFAVAAGLGVYFLVIAPKLAPEEDPGEGPDVPIADIPANPVGMDFEDGIVNVLRDGSGPASTLLYAVTLECNGQATVDFITPYMSRFKYIIDSLHDSRTRDELDDMLVFKESVREQAMQKLNALLVQIQGEKVNEEYRITNVFHRKCFVNDPLQ
jgi:flagellar basal body-associated protein FliL